jgi:dTDP-4-amino-4,6-dideoxygalactose transaminase
MKKNNNPIYITRPTLPDLDEFIPYLQQIWDTRILTNNGPIHNEFEKALTDYLGVPYISLFTNGTHALIAALQVLHITGEVITTPYSFVATTHSLCWNNIKPVFVDIEPSSCNLDPNKIEAAITPKTTAILPVHVYGNPCNVEKIQEIADTYRLKVIYDAAHAFGVNYKNQSVLNFGDLSILSFHATKVFNTFEGGAIICHDKTTKKHIDYLKDFGFDGETSVITIGINSKMNEIQAALGLLQLKQHHAIIEKRKNIVEKYRNELINIKGISFLQEPPDVISNYAYLPIFVDEKAYGMNREQLYEKLKKNNIHGRRYFYPLISEFPMYKTLDSANPNNLIVAEKTANEVICLPLYPELDFETIHYIAHLIRN